MEFLSILKENNIDVNLLQKNLKNIGFDIARFEGVAKEQLPLLIELFKTTLSIIPGKSSRNEKVALQVKLKNILKGLPVKATVKPIKERTGKKQPVKSQRECWGRLNFTTIKSTI
ncbi:MAG: hypothetical protein LUH15_15070 [Tannerellaceae bacterium]|nr:hypothetical protein [Tannerellaceae bacterium]